MSVDLKSIVTRFANAGGLNQEDIGIAVAAGLLYTDGHCWQLTEAGRHLLLQNPKSWLGDVDEPVLTTGYGCTPVPDAELQESVTQAGRRITCTLAEYFGEHGVNVPVPQPSEQGQVGGDHYKKLGKYQPWEVLRKWLTPEEFRGYCKGEAIVYVARELDKGGLESIEKAYHTLGFLIKTLKA